MIQSLQGKARLLRQLQHSYQPMRIKHRYENLYSYQQYVQQQPIYVDIGYHFTATAAITCTVRSCN